MLNFNETKRTLGSWRNNAKWKKGILNKSSLVRVRSAWILTWTRVKCWILIVSRMCFSRSQRLYEFLFGFRLWTDFELLNKIVKCLYNKSTCLHINLCLSTVLDWIMQFEILIYSEFNWFKIYEHVYENFVSSIFYCTSNYMCSYEKVQNIFFSYLNLILRHYNSYIDKAIAIRTATYKRSIVRQLNC